jgi:hypothetical protein
MSAPLMPSPLDHIGRQQFSFRPPIKHADPNEWMLAVVSWSDVKVVNPRTGLEVWIPRQYVDSVSYSSGPMLLVRLTKELEYAAGTVHPRVKRVIEMPVKTDPGTAVKIGAENRSPGPAPVVGIRVEDRPDSATNKALVYTGTGAVLISILAALFSALARL